MGGVGGPGGPGRGSDLGGSGGSGSNSSHSMLGSVRLKDKFGAYSSACLESILRCCDVLPMTITMRGLAVGAPVKKQRYRHTNEVGDDPGGHEKALGRMVQNLPEYSYVETFVGGQQEPPGLHQMGAPQRNFRDPLAIMSIT